MNNQHIQLDFNFCRRLDFQKNLVLGETQPFFDKILHKIPVKKILLIKHLKFLVIELFSCWSESEHQFLAVSMSKRGYKAKSRYNPNKISSVVIEAINYLKENIWIDFFPGFYDVKTNISRLTRIKASQKLISLFKKSNINVYKINKNDNREVIFLMDCLSKPQEYKDNFVTHEMREILRNYNALMLKTFFDIPCINNNFIIRGDNVKVIISFLRVTQSRYFHKNWKKFGIITGSWWDNLDILSLNKYSSHMLINHSETSFIDLSNLLPVYMSKKFNIFLDNMNLEIFKKYTNIIKNIDQLNYIFIKGFSAKNFENLYRSFSSEKAKLGIRKLVKKSDFKNLVNIISKYFPKLYEKFYSKIYIDWEGLISEIFYQFLRSSGASNIPVIKIKDKFFFQSKFESNVLKNIRISVVKVLKYEKFDLNTKKCFSYKFEKKPSFFDSLISGKLQYSNRYKENKKNFAKLMKKNNISVLKV